MSEWKNKALRERVTLAAVLALLQETDRVVVVHRLGPHMCESVAEGTAQEILSSCCVEICGSNVVESVSLETENLALEPWTDETAPVLVIAIGGKEAKR